jgi:RNA polymerase-binding transcription factor DksA
MTKPQSKAFRRILEGRETELAGRNCTRDALAIQRHPDDLDRIQEVRERELALGRLDRNSQFMREVRDALTPFYAGTLGICTGCEQKINPDVSPRFRWASMCVVCQEVADREQNAPWSESERPLVLAAWKELLMLWTVFIVLLVLWLLGFTFSVGGGLIHLLLVVALVILVFNLVTGRRGMV